MVEGASAATGAGYQGACSPAPATTLIATNAEAAGPDTEANWYLVWTQVPEGTVYVVYSYRSQLSWQRPGGLGCERVGPRPRSPPMAIYRICALLMCICR